MAQYSHKAESIEREIQILNVIENNPNLNHNSIINIIVNKEKSMAKATFEKSIKNMLEKNIINVEQIGNKKYYSIKQDYEHIHQTRLERGTEILFHSIKKQSQHLKERYQHLSIDEKSHSVIQIILDCLTVGGGFTIIDALKNPKKILYKDEQIFIQEIINEMFHLMKNDKDFEHTYKIVSSYLLPDLSENYQNLEKF